MAKDIQKYFIAIVPKGEIQEKATRLKLQLKETFGLKYALRSPAHITLKMPFSWNGRKEENLIQRLELYFREHDRFSLAIGGLGRFSKRVVFLKVEENPHLICLQKDLREYCKLKLKLTVELSDKAFTPHMTLAFKDVKTGQFMDYVKYLRGFPIKETVPVHLVSLLKRTDGKWEVIADFVLKQADPG